jgi:hydrophobe/amphiphile efflux-3 (HAE3) family protein
MKRMMSFFARLCRDNARLIIVLCIVLTIPVAVGITFIDVEPGRQALIPTKYESAQTFESIDDEFGGVIFANVSVESDGLLSYPMIKKFMLLEEEMKDEIGEEDYLWMEHYLTAYVVNVKREAGKAFGLELDDLSMVFIQEGSQVPNPENPDETISFEEAIEYGALTLLEDPVAQKWIVDKEGASLLSSDLKHALIRIKINPELEATERNELAMDIEAFFQSYFGEGEDPARTAVAGEIAVDKDLDSYLYSSTWLLAILAFILLILVLYLTFRRLSDVVLPLLVIVISVLWIYGLMGWFNLPYTIISVAIGPLVLGINLGNLLYMMSRFYEELGIRKDQRKASGRAIMTVGVAIFLAAVTTVVAFASFGLSDFDVLQQFGFMASVGVAVCFIFSVTFLPSLMILREDRRVRRGKKDLPKAVSIYSLEKQTRVDRMLKWTSGISQRSPRAVVVVFAFIVFICLLGTFRLSTTSDLRALAPQDIPSIQAEYEQEEIFGGQQIDFVLLKGDVLTPEVLIAMREFQEELDRSPYFNAEGVGSIGELVHDYLMATGEGVETDYVAVNPGTLEEAEAAVAEVGESFSPQEGKLISDDHQAALVSIYSSVPDNTEDALNKNDFLKQAAANHFDLPGVEYKVGGYTPLTADLLGNLVPTQIWTALLALGFAALVLMLIFRSIAYGLATLTVLVAGVAVEMGFLVLMGWELDMMTVLIATMVIGIGIDYGIHITHRFHEEYQPGKVRVEQALDTTIMGVGKPLVSSAAATAGAFLIISFSQMAPIRRFGALTAISLLSTLAASLLVLPSIITLVARRRRLSEKMAVEEKGEYLPAEAEG